MSTYPLRHSVPAALAIVTVTLTVVGIAVELRQAVRRLETDAARETVALNRVAAGALDASSQQGTPGLVAGTLERLAADPRVALVLIAGADGTVSASTDTSLAGRPIAAAAGEDLVALVARARALAAAQTSVARDGARLTVATPFPAPAARADAPGPTAVLVTQVDLAAQRRAVVSEIVRRSGLIGLIALGACLGVWLYLRRTFMAQLDALGESIRSYSVAQPVPAVPFGGSRELAEIGAAITQMLSDLRAEHARLSESEEKFARIFQGAPALVTLSEIETGRFIDVNDMATRLTGYTRDEIIGSSSVTLGWVSAEARARMIDILKRDGRVSGLEMTLRTKDGRALEGLLFAEVVSIDGQSRLLLICQNLTEYRRAQQARLDSERQFRQLLDKSPIATCIVRDATLQYANQAMADMHHVASPAEIVGQPIQALIAPELRPFALERARLRMSGAAVEERFESVHLRADGAAFPVRGVVTSVQLSDGPTAIGFFEDVSVQRDIEMRLRASEARFRQLFEQAADCIFILDRAGAVIDVNQAACQSLGYTRDELRQMKVEDFEASVPPESLRGLFQKEVPPNGATVTGTHRRKDGGLLPVEVRVSLFEDQGRTLILAATRDVSTRLEAEQHVRESEARFRAIVENSHDGIIFADEHANIIYRSPSYDLINGYSAEERLGHSGFDTVHPDDVAIVRRAWARMLAAPDAVEQVEYRIRHKDGSWRWLDTIVRNLLHNPNVRAAVVTSRDVTERKRAEAEREALQTQLAQSQKIEAVGRLAGGVAHDFNNMLSVILGFAEMALDSTAPGQPLREDLLEIQKAAERSGSLTRQLLAFARQQPVSPRVIDLNATVQDMLTMLRRLIGENITLAWQPAASLAKVFIDPTQIDQILANLCVNARDAISGVGTVRIETLDAVLDADYCATHPGARPGDYVCLAVRDSGCGMSPEVLAHIFEPFYTTKGVGKGTGLGLATVYGVVKQNAGYIDVHSQPGHGSRFAIYLPAQHAAVVKPVAPRSIEPVAGGKGTVLLVEDEAAVLMLTKRVLEHLGYRVLASTTPQDALRLASEADGRIDLLMTDVIMPEMNGRDLAERVQGAWPGIRCLFTSGYTADLIADHGVLDEGVQFLKKPWSKDELATKVHDALAQI